MKKIILTLIIFAFSLSIVSAQENAAKRALAEGDYQAAIKLYKVVIATSNDETQSANIYNEIKNAQKCDELLSQANKAYKKKKYSEAKKLYQSILKYNPSDKFSKKRVSLCSNNTSQQNKSNTSTQNTTTVSKPSKGTANGHEYVDLGLSVNWATCNVGANKPEDYGDYFAWGETKTKYDYSSSNSVTRGKNYSDIGGKSQYDAARANWGGTWRLPTKAELVELMNKCTWTWTTQNGVKGCKVTGPNGNSIFLPAAGDRRSSSLYFAGKHGTYWSSTPDESSIYSAYYLLFDSGGHGVRLSNRGDFGRSVRPVCNKDANVNNTTSQQNSTNVQSTTSQQNKSNTNAQNTTKESKSSKGTANGHEYVDLGLPSGLKWATCNVGANKPEDSGHYFAWGETKTKSEYTYNTANNRDPEKLGDISGNPKYDAARANWGGEWRMPKFKEFIELIDNCIVKETTQNGVNGFKFTSKTNGNSIFFPAGGHRQGTKILYPGRGNYWSSTLNYDHFVKYISFDGYPSRTFDYYWFGFNIRPVIK